MTQSSPLQDRSTLLAFGLIAGLLAVRMVLLAASPLELYADEAQYWRWGQSLEWGYYSKPPMIAWVIYTSTAFLGDSEWAIRFLAPIFHAVAATILFLLARRMFDERAALFGLRNDPRVLMYVRWPNGQIQKFFKVDANQHLHLVQP